MEWTKEQIIDLIEENLGETLSKQDLVELLYPTASDIRILDYVDSLSDFELGNCEGLFLCGKNHPNANYRTVETGEGHVFLAFEGPADATDEELIKAYSDDLGAPASLTFDVELLAFDDLERTRKVDVPLEELKGCEDDLQILNVIYRLGQNDFQPRPMPSVSAGDVINLRGSLYLVASIGFEKIDEDFLKEYKKLPRRDRSFHPRVRGD